MDREILILALTSASIGFLHTLMGPDHYLPFIMMSRAGKWSKVKTVLITLICGLGHVGSSILIGSLGVFLGITVEKICLLEQFRGNIAAWLLAGFGLAYFIYGLRKAIINKPHKHLYPNKEEQLYYDSGIEDHQNIGNQELSVTPWALFVIFILGPCEPLIPILMYPAAQSSISGMILVTSLFCIFTIITMLILVMLSLYGIDLLPHNRLDRYSHAIAGFTLSICGVGIIFLGL